MQGNAIEFQAKMDDVVPLFRERLAEGQKVKFSPRGVSMLPMLRQGIDSVVLVPVPEKLSKYDLPLYQRDDGKYILHRVVKVGTHYTCAGDNQSVLEHGVRHDQLIALVSGFYRKDRYIPVSDPFYRAYCSLWHHSRGIRFFIRRVARFLFRRKRSK